MPARTVQPRSLALMLALQLEAMAEGCATGDEALDWLCARGWTLRAGEEWGFTPLGVERAREILRDLDATVDRARAARARPRR